KSSSKLLPEPYRCSVFVIFTAEWCQEQSATPLQGAVLGSPHSRRTQRTRTPGLKSPARLRRTHPPTLAFPGPNSFSRERRQSLLRIKLHQARCRHSLHTAWKHLQQRRCRAFGKLLQSCGVRPEHFQSTS